MYVILLLSAGQKFYNCDKCNNCFIWAALLLGSKKCVCGWNAYKAIVGKGDNKGKHYYKCLKCEKFEWADNSAASTSSSKSKKDM